jgi:hypothetical protein
LAYDVLFKAAGTFTNEVSKKVMPYGANERPNYLRDPFRAHGFDGGCNKNIGDTLRVTPQRMGFKDGIQNSPQNQKIRDP